MELTMSAWNGTFEEWEDTRPATDAEVLAYVATLDGAEVSGTYSDHRNFLRKEPLYALDLLVSKPGRYLVIPLPDKGTTDEFVDRVNQVLATKPTSGLERPLPDEETP